MTTRPLATWLRVQAAVWSPVLLVLAARPALATGALRTAIAVLVGLCFLPLFVRLRAGRTLADWVTAGRLLGLAMIVGVADVPWSMASWVGACAVVAADLLDGFVARQCGGSAHGAQLDMETDQFVVLGLAVAAVGRGGGAHVLLLPALRYAFVLAAWGLRIDATDPKPVAGDNRRGRLVCAGVMVLLLVALHPQIPVAIADAATAVAALLLAWSFAGDARFLLAQRRQRRVA